MKEIGQRRTLWLGGALLIALLAAQWVNGQDGSGDQVPTVPEQKVPKREMREIRAAENDSAQLELDRLERRKFNAQAGDLFSPKSWIPITPVSTKVLPPSPPPLMFKYLGKVTEGEETRVFLALAEHNYVVKPGETINNQYRVDGVTDHTITFTYIPLNAKQVLATGGGV